MSAYVIMIRESTNNAEELKIYGEMVRPTMKAFEMTPLVAYGAYEVLEGPPIEGVVIVRFKSMDEARAWYNSPEYQAAREHRFKGATYSGVLVEGV